MKIERTKNASRNMVFGAMLRCYQIVIPFVMRTVMLYVMGVEYLGLNSLFNSLLQVLNLAELGVGSAMIYSMYKPIAEDDRDQICALLRLYRMYYRMIGVAVLTIGLAMLPLLPMLVKSDVPADLSLTVLYLLNLGTTVLTYWLFAYRTSLLQAHQREDLVSKVGLMASTVQYALQIIVIVTLKNYYIYLIISLASQVMNNIMAAVISRRIYPTYKPRGILPKDKIKAINQRIRDLFTSKLGAVIVNYADTVVISAFLGLTALAVYQNYFFILSAVISCIAIIFGACTAGVGNSLVVETKSKNFQDLSKFTFIITWIAGFCACCFLCLFQPFMEIWVGRELMLEQSAVVCLSIYFFVFELNQLLNMYKDAAGIWHKDRFRPLTTALSNLVMNLLLVNYWGIYGVILSTVLSTVFVGMPWLLHNLFTSLFEPHELKGYLKKLLHYAAVIVASCAVTYFVCGLIPLTGWAGLLGKLGICLVLPNAIYCLVYRGTKEFKEAVQLLKKVTNGRLNLSHIVK